MKIKDVENATIEQIVFEFNTQIIYMCMGCQDDDMINALAKELKVRGEYDLVRKYQLEVLQAYRR